jgi:outer membrane biosynthesis protein TonB
MKKGIPECPEMDAAALKVVRKLKPFLPANIQAKSIPFIMYISVRFVLNE